MKKTMILVIIFASFCFSGSIIKVIEGATNSGISKAYMIPEQSRPVGFIIKHVQDDLDNDGIKDEKDRCKNTPSGKVVDKDGCTKVIVLRVGFDFDKYDIKEKYRDKINEAFYIMKKNSTYKAIVEGHTDSIGTYEYNYKLSNLRAKSVARVLIELGIAKNRIITKGYGETVPVASNATKEGRAKNRRVEISFNKN